MPVNACWSITLRGQPESVLAADSISHPTPDLKRAADGLLLVYTFPG